MRSIVFHADGGPGVGLGHVRRCLSLAQTIAKCGVEPLFVVPTALVSFVEDEAQRAIGMDPPVSGAALAAIARDAEALIVDSYRFDGYGDLRSHPFRVIALDDLGRTVDADLIINGACGAENIPYRPGTQRLLVGCRYALLRPEFAKRVARTFEGSVKRVFITVGGFDDTGLAVRISERLAASFPSLVHDVVIGPMSDVAGGMPAEATVHCNPPEMSTLMRRADIAISGGGQALYELAATGTPAIAVRVAANQTSNLLNLAAAGVIDWVGDAADHDVLDRIITAVQRLVGDAAARRQMSERGRLLIDGHGAERVADVIVSLKEHVRA